MSKMREAFEEWWKAHAFKAEHEGRMHVAFDCGYQAAIADVKAGGPETWQTQKHVHTSYVYDKQSADCAERHEWKVTPLYKLPEDI